MNELLARLPELLFAHLRLSLWALCFGVLISVPLGIVAHRKPVFRNIVLGFVGVTQTIPSLALLAFMVPAIAAVAPAAKSALGVTLSAIGTGPALLALTFYGMLPVLQNTVAGLRGVDDAMTEAARGVGMTEGQVLWQVELPLALPVIAAGIRTAAVWTVGTAVLATPVGAQSLGDYIFVGLQTRNHLSVAVGCVASAGLALGLDLLVKGIERASQPGQARARGVPYVLALFTLLIGSVLPTGLAHPTHIRVGSKAFAESYLFAEMVGLRCESVGLTVEQVPSLGSAVIFEALQAGDLDAYVDFSGTILINVMKEPVPKQGASGVFSLVQTWLSSRHGIQVAARLGYENRYAFAVRRPDSVKFKLRTLSDLAKVAPRLSAVASYEFFDRPEWQAVQQKYGMAFSQTRTMEQALAYEAVRTGEVDVMVAFSTDARVKAFDLVLLNDDRDAIPPYEAMVLVAKGFSERFPQAMKALAALNGHFSEASVQSLNLALDGGVRSPRMIAEKALLELGID